MIDTKDRLTESDLREIVGDREIKNYVETGTWQGAQLAIACKVFETVIGIELDLRYAALSLQNAPNADMRVGKSEDLLPNVIAQPGLEGEPICFYLDAHYCKLDPPIEESEFPLWKELEIICERNNKGDIIIVDDVHTFGRARPDIHTPEWEGVTTASLDYLLNRKGRVVKDCYVLE